MPKEISEKKITKGFYKDEFLKKLMEKLQYQSMQICKTYPRRPNPGGFPKDTREEISEQIYGRFC